jgi:general secretion pathway protein A
VDARLVHAAADEVQLGEPGVYRRRWPWIAAAAALVLVLAAWWWLPGRWSVAPGEGQAPAVAEAVADPVNEPGPTMPATEPPPQPVQEQPKVTQAQPINATWLESQHALAWAGLAAAWGEAGDAQRVAGACEGRDGLGYACLRDQGSWARIERLGLPVVLILQTPDTRHLLLRHMDGSRLTLGAPDATREAERDDLEPHWLGSYYVAWPQSPGWPRELGPGASGPALDALFDMAARADSPYRGTRSYGNQFETWLRAFQVRNGLEPDGIVGPRTLLYLMRHSITEPSLAPGD